MRGAPEEGPGARAPSLVGSTVHKTSGDVKSGRQTMPVESPFTPVGRFRACESPSFLSRSWKDVSAETFLRAEETGWRSNWQESPGLGVPGDFSSEVGTLGYIIVRSKRPRSSAG